MHLPPPVHSWATAAGTATQPGRAPCQTSTPWSGCAAATALDTCCCRPARGPACPPALLALGALPLTPAICPPPHTQAATTPTIARGGFRDSGDQLTSGGGGGAALSKAASAMGEGPLAMGVCSKGGLKAHSNPVALGAAAVGSSSSRSSDGNPFSDAVRWRGLVH